MLRCARQTIREWCKKRGYEPATISFFHSFGEKLQFHPHFHILVTAGGLRPNGAWHYTDGAMPPHILMPIFKAKFIAGMKALFEAGTLTTKAKLSRVFYQMNAQHDKHWQFYVKRVTKRSAETMRYCVRYAKKMIISEKRIVHYDGSIVMIKTKTSHITYPVGQFLGLILQHIPEKQFRLISYDGFYANKSGPKYQQAAKCWEPLSKIHSKTSWRERQWARNKRDPLTCKRCKTELVQEKVQHGKKWIYFKMEDIYRANGIVRPRQLALNSSWWDASTTKSFSWADFPTSMNVKSANTLKPKWSMTENQSYSWRITTPFGQRTLYFSSVFTAKQGLSSPLDMLESHLLWWNVMNPMIPARISKIWCRSSSQKRNTKSKYI